MLFRLILLLTIVPLVELWLLLWISDRTSLLFTVGLVIVTGVLGAALARWQGLRTLTKIQSQLQDGKMPGDALFDGVLILLAAAVLVTPGILTDACGFLLLIPPCRQVVKGILRRGLAGKIQAGGSRAVHVHWQASGSQFHATDGEWESERDRHEVIDARVIEPPTKPAEED